MEIPFLQNADVLVHGVCVCARGRGRGAVRFHPSLVFVLTVSMLYTVMYHCNVCWF